MSWGGFALALGVVYIVQVGAISLTGWTQFDPFLVLAILYGLAAPRHDARIAGWIIGLTQDLGSVDALGVHAFTLGLTGLIITKLREAANVNVWWVRGLIALVAAFPAQTLYLLHVHYWAGNGGASPATILLQSFLISVIAGGIAMIITTLPNLGYGSKRRGYRTYPH